MISMKRKIEEKIRDTDCNICKYVFYDPFDKDELQKCRGVSMEPKPIINMDLLKRIAESPNKKLNFCEYFDRR